ncbi:MAG: HPF/RaiA family ribosome-associated protein [Sphingomonadales bacterium]|nr:HPF/RaiA family ribosome-associated protein [Sphingomonadales bacterium]
MLVQINTDSRVEGPQDVTASYEERVQERLSRFADRLTRVEVHVRDADGHRNGPRGIEVALEARPAGGQPITVTDHGSDPAATLNGALRKAVDALDRTFGKLDSVR